MQWINHLYGRFETVWSTASRRKRACIYICVYTGLFLLAFLLAYSPFLLGGKTFIWYKDGRNTHYRTLVYVGRYLRQIVLNLLHGELSIPLFDLSLGMGEDVIATLNYYGFGNPLYFLAAIVPTKHMEGLYNFLAIFRIYLAGLAFSTLCVYHKKRISHILIGALIYGFSGYTIYCAVRHPYFISPMIQLPLLLIGADQIICRKRSPLFIITVFYSALCGFYFLYMMTIMVGIYAAVRFFDCCSSHRIREFARMAGRIIQNYILGVGMAAPLFIPAVIGFLSSSRSGMTVVKSYFSYGWGYYRDNFLAFFAPPAHWNYLSVAAISLFSLTLFFSKRKPCRSLKRLFSVCMIFYILPLGGLIMNGFGYPSQRWTFAFALLVSYITVEMMPTLLHLSGMQKMGCLLTLTVYAICVFCSPQNRKVHYVVGAAMLGFTLVVLLLVQEVSDNQMRNGEYRRFFQSAGAIACIILVISNVSVNAVYKFAADQANYIDDFQKSGVETERLISAVEREAGPYLAEQSGRFDSRSFTYNTGAVWHVPTLQSAWSIGNSYVHDFWYQTENIGIFHSSAQYLGADQRAITESLLSAKYFITEEGDEAYWPYGSEAVKKNGENLVYENHYALPWGYTYDSYIPYDKLEPMNGLEREEAMLQSIALEVDLPEMHSGVRHSSIEQLPYDIVDMNYLKWENGKLKVQKDNATVVLEFQIPEATEGYLRLQGLDINGSSKSSFYVTVKCKNVSKRAYVTSEKYTWYFGRENYLFNLGYSGEARTTCTITFPKKGTYRLEDIALYALPMDKFPEQVEALRAEPLENIAFGTNRITGTVDLSDSKILCISVPYSKGWSAKVDGAKAEILRGNIMFMALPLTAGYHEIELRYCTPGLRPGIVLSILSFGVVTAAYIRRRKNPG